MSLIFRIPAVQESAPSRGLSSLGVEACSVERYGCAKFLVQKLVNTLLDIIFLRRASFGRQTSKC